MVGLKYCGPVIKFSREYNKALEYFNLSASILKQMKKENLDKDAFYDYDITNTIDLCTAYDKKE